MNQHELESHDSTPRSVKVAYAALGLCALGAVGCYALVAMTWPA